MLNLRTRKDEETLKMKQKRKTIETRKEGINLKDIVYGYVRDAEDTECDKATGEAV